MKLLTQFAGLIIVLISVVLVIVEFVSQGHNNNLLLVSGILLLAGLFLHVVLNKQLM